ncbi:GlxA family transcriptional regulator [Massilia pseudoviolaceinigra]|uniref:GlxA family transcriptional regulator n=1 Tax=Massilia pseudoviolaceinigra TaxID=3057165 RepID=UPI002796A514|nr:helix-turn-helix domain-containing protein [Massilia sp. CCM 9206]MDQ1924526.1 helix-turn-helix domain-containing protein [Massilia sp. CCM 9206]
MHKIAILAPHGVIPFDLATACEVFSRVRVAGLPAAYEVVVCGEAASVTASLFDLHTRWNLSHAAGAHTLIIPGIDDIDAPVSEPVLATIRAAAAGGARIASICSGAFLLAASGLLDGQRATTHWMAAGELARRFPAVTVDPNVLFVDNGKFLTSAGAAVGLDLCLYLVRRDYGAAAAADAARAAVMPLERGGGQAQFIVHPEPSSSLALQPVLKWMESQLHSALTLEAIAAHAALSKRTLSRRFLEQTGTSPLQWLLGARVRRAQYLLETSALSIEQVANATGFGSSAALRACFGKQVGTSPHDYRQSFRSR